MSERGKKRDFLAYLKKRFPHPKAQEFLLKEARRGAGGTEVYTLFGDTDVENRYFNVSEMKEYAHRRKELRSLPPDIDRANRIIASGAIDEEHLFETTLTGRFDPIIVCTGMEDGDQIVDGAHRFVAFCMAVIAANVELPMAIPGYVFEPHEWKRFLIPRDIVLMLGIATPKPTP